MPAARATPQKAEPATAPGPVPGALFEVEKNGSLLRLIPDRADRLQLTKSLIEQGLIAWSKAGGRYQLTAAGRKSLDQRDKPVAVVA